MWLMTSVGFFSAVQKPGQTGLTVRARVKSDLEALRETYLPELGDIIDNAGTDYPFRAHVSHAAFAGALAHIVRDVTYSNFKGHIGSTQGSERAHVYSKIWTELLSLEKPSPPPPAPKSASKPTPAARPAGRPMTYGGVVLNADGKLLLREPANHFDGYVWTFAKGAARPGEAPEQAALREVREETGVHAAIVARVPGEFAGGTSDTIYWIMRLVEISDDRDQETASVRWCTVAEARDLIGTTRNAVGRARDLSVLEAAVAAITKMGIFLAG